jgi:hypothetical protein
MIEQLQRCEILDEREVKLLCEKAVEILVEESNVQVYFGTTKRSRFRVSGIGTLSRLSFVRWHCWKCETVKIRLNPQSLIASFVKMKFLRYLFKLFAVHKPSC